jgi:hypothetical protein
MNAHARAPSETPNPGAPDAWERALLDRQLQTLDRLAEMGLAVAAAVQARATAPDASDAAVTHAALDFARVSRAVRMTLALQSRLVRDFKTPVKAASAKADDDKDEVEIPKNFAIYWADGSPVNAAAERRVLRETVRDLATDRGLDRETAERLETEALERFERDSVYPVYSVPGALPYRELVAKICEDLGLKPGATRAPPFSAENGGEDPFADPGAKPGEERMGVGEGGSHPPFDRFPERPPTWSG